MNDPSARQVTIQAPATIGNFGPGMDVLSLALADQGDRVTLRAASEDSVEVVGPGCQAIPTAWSRNVAGAAIDALREATGVTTRFHMRLEKKRPPASGIGSSASSAGGAALAFHALHPDLGLDAHALHRAGVAGEAIVGGNPDDVASVILGGLAIVPHGAPIRRVQPPPGLHLAMVLPAMALETTAMRALLPEAWPRADALWNMGRVAAIVDAFHAGDVAAIAACFDDRIQVPYRRSRLPHLDACSQAARDAGALGACLSGSGPAVAAICNDPAVARDAAAAMADACGDLPDPLEADGFAATPETRVMHNAVLLH